MGLLSVATQVAMLKATEDGGVGRTIVDVGSGESSYGHWDEESAELLAGEVGAVLTSEPSVVVVNGAFTSIGPKKGINRQLTVGGQTYYIRRIEAADPDGGVLRLFLSEKP